MGNCHVKWLRAMVAPMKAEGHTAWANTCEHAANELEAVQSHRDTLLEAHLKSQSDAATERNTGEKP
jgi:hypothetical protein